jgi:DNA-binding response OmpR family regulator
VCRRIRARSSVPVIIVSAFGQPADKARGLSLGADDYVTKPYDTIELSARIEAVLRRAQGRPPMQSSIFRCGVLTIDYEQRLVTMSGKEIQLSRTEYRLLEYLSLNAGRTLVADALLSKVWGPEYLGDYASLHLYISRLRRKLGEDAHGSRLIVTKPGIGYMMPNDSEDSTALKERVR